MQLTRLLAATGVALAVTALSAASAGASPITYTFTGTGSGIFGATLVDGNETGGTAFSGDFTVTLVGDTTAVDASGAPTFRNAATSATFMAGALSATLTGASDFVVLTTDPGFPSIAFDQGQSVAPFDVGEGLVNTNFESYDLKTAFPLTSGAVSVTLPSTYFSSSGDIVFQNITALNFQAVTGAVPEPATWAMMLLGVFGIGMALRIRRQPQPAAVA